MKSTLVKSSPTRVRSAVGSTVLIIFLSAFSFISRPVFSQNQPVNYKTVHVKFKEEFVPNHTGRSTRSGMRAMDLVSEKYAAASMERIYPDAGKFEKAHRAYGLHLWYEVKFPQGADTARAIIEYKNLNYFEKVEPCREYMAGWDRNEDALAISSTSILTERTNDPLYGNQWHYKNTGQTGGTPGADINLERGWRIETGSSNVIVAVIDGGVDLIHPDLKDAMWTNTDEIPGNGIDDDHNGYRDDIHGYNFGDGESTIYPDVHGTHVAGTIGAVSNNGIGVAGIAGGSGSANGVRIMSLSGFGKFGTGGFESAMVYAADNGAVISQNSWGGGSTAIEAAIGYFIERAGLDNSNANFDAKIQTGPMAGGIVIFAAGNDNTFDAFFGYPGSHPRVMAVASLNHNDVKAGTSNYGGWVDISAPGDQVLSTKPGSQYGLLSGTSMACPHVSGVAALLISHLQQPGLKPSEIRNRILQSAKSVDNKNPDYIGMLGSGKLNAFSMFGKRDLIPPGAITDLHATSVRNNSITLQWTAPGESGSEGGPPEKYDIRMSTAPITAENFMNASIISAPIPTQPGQQQTLTVNSWLFQATTYFAIKSTDVYYYTSGMSNVAAVTRPLPGILEINKGELIEELKPGSAATYDIELKNAGVEDLTFRIVYPDSKPLSWVTFSSELIHLMPGEIKHTSITLNAVGIVSGEYTGQALFISQDSDLLNTINLILTIPDIALKFDNLIDFKNQLTGIRHDSTLTLRNDNATELIISSIQSNDSRVTASKSSLKLAPSEEYNLTISVAGTEAASVDATVTFTTNDPEFETIDLRVRANLITNPEITISPETIEATLSLAETKTFNVTVANPGAELFAWNTNYPAQAAPSVNLNQFIQRASSPLELTALSYDPVAGYMYGKALSEPGFYRYNFSANNWTAMAGGPSTIYGQAVYFKGKIYHPGQKLEVYTIGSNSWASIVYPTGGACETITTDGQYLYMVFGKVLFRYDPDGDTWLQLITFTGGYGISIGSLSYWNGIIYAAESTSGAITGDGNTPLFKYFINSNTWVRTEILRGKVNSCSAIDPIEGNLFTHFANQLNVRNVREGIEVQRIKPFSTEAQSMIYIDKPGYTGIYSIHENKTLYRFETAPLPSGWITVSPASGEIPAGATQNLTVKVGSPDLPPGIHTGEIEIFEANSKIKIDQVDVHINVSDVPEISLSKNSADAGQVAIGNSRLASLQIRNTGSAPLVINNVTIDNPNFLIDITSYTIQAGEQITVYPQLKPLVTGELTGTFIFHSNDPDESNTVFRLTGKGIATSLAEITPASASVNILAGDKFLQNIVVSNGGGSDFFGVLINHVGNWLTAPYGATLLSSAGSLTAPITLDAKGKSAGVYEGKVVLYYRDEALGYSADIDIPLTMTVTDAPGIRADGDSLNFGSRYVGSSYDTIIKIINTGTLPLSITNITTDNPAFTLLVTAPLNLAPGQSVDATIIFNPEVTGLEDGNISFTSNDPTNAIYNIPVSGFGVTLPDFNVNVSEIHQSAFTDQHASQTFEISNSGGSKMNWKLGLDNEELGIGFTQRMSTPQFAIATLASNPATGFVYAQSSRTNSLYEYNPVSDQWITVAGKAPGINTVVHAGAVIVNSSMYCFFDQDPGQLYVYDIALKKWTVIPNKLGVSTTAITTDGNLIYLAGDNTIKSFSPGTGIWITLPVAPTDLNGIGGIQYLNGMIYAHGANNRGFAVYVIVEQHWRLLSDSPDAMALESTIDPELERYYVINKDGNNLYEYDISAELWTVIRIPFFNVKKGRIVYAPVSENKGIYFTEGSSGFGFGQYHPREVDLGWLKVSPLLGVLESSGNQHIKLNFSAHNLNTGTYKATLKILSNDPDESVREIPVTFEVTYPGAVIKVPELLEGSLNRQASITTTLKIENAGGAPLEWNLAATLLPVGLTVSKSSGTIAAAGFENITLTYVPGFFSPRIFDYALEINSNDKFAPAVSTQLKFVVTTALNMAPVVEQVYEDRSVVIGTLPLEVLISGTFSDPEGDAIQYTVTSSDDQIASLNLVDNKLKIFIFGTGSSKITITGTDTFDAATSTDFDVTISEVVTDVEPGIEKTLSAYPNPFTHQVSVRYTTEKPTRAAIMLFDISGKMVWQSTGYAEVQGVNEVLITGDQLPSGIYHARLMRKDNPIVTVRLMKH